LIQGDCGHHRDCQKRRQHAARKEPKPEAPAAEGQHRQQSGKEKTVKYQQGGLTAVAGDDKGACPHAGRP
jgi:hypothetical protein